MIYRFVGSSESQLLKVADGRVVGTEVLADYGQAVELDEAAAVNAISGGAAIVPDAAFNDDQAAMRKLAAELIHQARETGIIPLLPAAKIQSGNEVIHGDGE